MADMQWPRNSWTVLSKIIRAWYSVETGSGEVTQKKVADVGGVQASQVSTNKGFLQAIGVLNSDGTSLTEAGKRLGVGLYSENENMKRQGFELIIKGNDLLRHLFDIVRGRGSLKIDDAYDEVELRVGGRADGFVTGVAILIDILTSSGAVEVKENTLRPSRNVFTEEMQLPRENNALPRQPSESGLKRIPIAVSTSAVWWIEVAEKPEDAEVEKFLEMQRLMFGLNDLRNVISRNKS